jgi:hypothetical protein
MHFTGVASYEDVVPAYRRLGEDDGVAFKSEGPFEF